MFWQVSGNPIISFLFTLSLVHNVVTAASVAPAAAGLDGGTIGGVIAACVIGSIVVVIGIVVLIYWLLKVSFTLF